MTPPLDCEHHWALDSIERDTQHGPLPAVATVRMHCTKCDEQRVIVTRRTDAEIRSEFDAQ